MANEMIWKFRFKLDDGSRVGRQKQIENFLYYGSFSIQKLLFLAFCTLSQIHTMLHNGLEPNQVNLENELENVRKSHNRLRIVYYYFLFLFFLIFIYLLFFLLFDGVFFFCSLLRAANHCEPHGANYAANCTRSRTALPGRRNETQLEWGLQKRQHLSQSASQVSQPAQASQAKPSSPASERPKRRSGGRRSRCRSCRRCRCRCRWCCCCRWSSQPMTLTAAVAATTS